MIQSCFIPCSIHCLYCALVFLLNISMGFSVGIIMGQTATLDCYDPITANKFEDYYIQLEFKSLFEKKNIVHYRPFDRNYVWYDKSYEARLTFLNSGQVEIRFIGLPDEGEYFCIPKSYHADPKSTRSTVVTVFVSPHVEVKMIDPPLKAGSKRTGAAQCIASGGKPPALVQWQADQFSDFSEAKNNETTASLTTVSSTLIVTPTKLLNNQEVLCEVNHPALDVKNITVIKLNVTYPPENARILVDKKKQHLTCVAEGNPPSSYEWKMPAGFLPPKKFSQTITMTKALDPKRQNDTYICTPSNSAGEGKSVNITVYDALHLTASQANISLIVGVSVGVVVAIALLTAAYCCLFRRSRRKDELMYSKQTQFVQHNVDRYSSSVRPYIQQEKNSSHKNRSAIPIRPISAGFYCDDDYEYCDVGSGYGGDVDIEIPVLPTEKVSLRGDHKAGIALSASDSFRRERPASYQGTYRSKTTHEHSSLSSERASQKYDFPPSEDEDYSSRRSSQSDDVSENGSGYMDVDIGSSKRKSNGRGQLLPPDEPPVIYAQVNKKRKHKKT